MNRVPAHNVAGQDPFERTVASFFSRFGGSSVLIILILIVVLAGMAALWTVSDKREASEAVAWKEAAEAIEKSDQSDTKDTAKLESVLKDLHSGRARSTMELVLAAQIHSRAIGEPPLSAKDREDNLRNARTLYERFLEDESHPLAALAMLNLAKVIEDSGNTEEASDAFMKAEKAARDGPLSFIASEAIWGQARCAARLGEKDKALNLINSAFDRVSKSGALPRWYRAASVLRDSLRSVDTKDNLLVEGAAADGPTPAPADEPSDVVPSPPPSPTPEPAPEEDAKG